MNFMDIVLASGSPRRSEILKQLGIEFRVVVSHEDADKLTGNPLEFPRKLAAAKALAVSRMEAGALVLGFDTLVFLDGQPLGKPKDTAAAFAMLKSLNNRTHKVITGVAIAKDGKLLDASEEETEVIFRNNTDQTLQDYVNSKDPMDKAGAYGIQTQGARLIHSVKGCFYNVVGLPIAKTLGMLEQLKV